MTTRVDHVALQKEGSQVFELPAEAELLDVRMIEGAPHLAFAFNPDLDGIRQVRIVAVPTGVDVDEDVDTLDYIPTNWRVNGGLTRYFHDAEFMSDAVDPADADPSARDASEGNVGRATGEAGGDDSSAGSPNGDDDSTTS